MIFASDKDFQLLDIFGIEVARGLNFAVFSCTKCCPPITCQFSIVFLLVSMVLCDLAACVSACSAVDDSAR